MTVATRPRTIVICMARRKSSGQLAHAWFCSQGRLSLPPLSPPRTHLEVLQAKVAPGLLGCLVEFVRLLAHLLGFCRQNFCLFNITDRDIDILRRRWQTRAARSGWCREREREREREATRLRLACCTTAFVRSAAARTSATLSSVDDADDRSGVLRGRQPALGEGVRSHGLGALPRDAMRMGHTRADRRV